MIGFLKANLWGMVIGLLVGSLITAGVLSSAADSIYGSKPQASASSSASVLDSRFPAAKTESQVSLFAASQTSCDAIRSVGAKFGYADGSTQLIAPVKDGAGNITDGFLWLTSTGQVRAAGFFNDAPPVPCIPADLNVQIQRGNTGLATEFLADDNATNVYAWHSHLGSDEVTNIYLNLDAGKVAGFDDLSTNVPGAQGGVTVEYGLTADEKAQVAAAVKG